MSLLLTAAVRRVRADLIALLCVWSKAKLGKEHCSCCCCWWWWNEKWHFGKEKKLCENERELKKHTSQFDNFVLARVPLNLAHVFNILNARAARLALTNVRVCVCVTHKLHGES